MKNMTKEITSFQQSMILIWLWLSGSVLDFESGGSKFESHCSQHVVVSLGKTLHPKLLLWGLSTVLIVC